MNKKINEIKNFIKKECEKNSLNDFYEHHLLGVEKNALELLSRLPKADKELVMLGVWLHDLQRIRKLKGDHEGIGAQEAQKVMEQFRYSPEMTTLVRDMILTHMCNEHIPTTLEARTLATADALSQYNSDWIINVAISDGMKLKEYKKFMIEKLEHNYDKRIFFNFAKKMIQTKHDAWMTILTT